MSKSLQTRALLELFFRLRMFSDYPEDRGGTMGEVKTEKTKIYEDYFQNNSRFFNSDSKKVAFLVGVLVKNLLNIQYEVRNSTPFQKRLKGLNLSRELLANLFRESLNKLEEYGRNYYRDLESLISDYFVKAANQNWENDREISFVFTLGLSLARLFKDANEKKIEIEGEIDEH